MRRHAMISLFILAALAAGCSNEHGDSPSAFEFDAPPAPTGLEATGGDYQVALSWDYPAEDLGAVEEFRVYYYDEAYDMVEFITAVETTSFTHTGLVPNWRFCYKVSAVDAFGIEGWRSDKACAYTTAP